jgi:SAM-dependent methyltransferase
MQQINYSCTTIIVLLLSWTGGLLFAQEKEPDPVNIPVYGQDGKDVTWIPTPLPLIEAMLTIANVTPDDFVIDLGSGDGRSVIAAAKRGARGMGIEYNEKLVEYSNRLAEEEGVADRVVFIEGDIFEADLSEATVITMFLLPSLNVRLAPVFMKLKPGTRIVSNSFGMGEWVPDDTAHSARPCRSYCDALLWVVPARVGGRWSMPGGELNIIQKYQTLTGTLTRGGITTTIRVGRLNGNKISFKTGFRIYTGQVQGDRIEGESESNHYSTRWKAIRH